MGWWFSWAYIIKWDSGLQKRDQLDESFLLTSNGLLEYIWSNVDSLRTLFIYRDILHGSIILATWEDNKIWQNVSYTSQLILFLNWTDRILYFFINWIDLARYTELATDNWQLDWLYKYKDHNSFFIEIGSLNLSMKTIFFMNRTNVHWSVCAKLLIFFFTDRLDCK